MGAMINLTEAGFRPVLDIYANRYATGFDRAAEYEFMREEWEAPSAFRLSEASPYFNLTGLMFRPLARNVVVDVAPAPGEAAA